MNKINIYPGIKITVHTLCNQLIQFNKLIYIPTYTKILGNSQHFKQFVKTQTLNHLNNVDEVPMVLSL